MRQLKIIVVGAGVAGLYCAQLLTKQGCSVQIWEASDRPGGRVQTDTVEGFRLDRGFQVLQTAYPEAQRALKYDALQLSSFDPGALVMTERGQVAMIDPWRKPSAALSTLFNHIGSLSDRMRMARLRSLCFQKGIEHTPESDGSTRDLLRQQIGFTPDFFNRFLRPWISGMFFDESLDTSAQFFRFIFRTLASGNAALPARGIGAMSDQLASHLPAGTIHYGKPVQKIEGSRVIGLDGKEEPADGIVLAVDGRQQQVLLSEPISEVRMVGTACFYFTATQSPPVSRSLVLNGELDSASGMQVGPISNLSVPSNVSSHYAPPGQSLICVSVRPSLVAAIDLNHQDQWQKKTEIAIREQATRWFGETVHSWQFLRAYVIPHAVPRLLPGQWTPHRETATSLTRNPKIVCCGDYLESPSLQGALVSGRRAAEQVLQWI